MFLLLPNNAYLLRYSVPQSSYQQFAVSFSETSFLRQILKSGKLDYFMKLIAPYKFYSHTVALCILQQVVCSVVKLPSLFELIKKSTTTHICDRKTKVLVCCGDLKIG